MQAAYAYRNVAMLCGQCHACMDGSISKNDFPVEYRVRCLNDKCENFGKVFRVGEEARVTLTDITDSLLMTAVDEGK